MRQEQEFGNSIGNSGRYGNQKRNVETGIRYSAVTARWAAQYVQSNDTHKVITIL
jgi:hypothetical protein